MDNEFDPTFELNQISLLPVYVCILHGYNIGGWIEIIPKLNELFKGSYYPPFKMFTLWIELCTFKDNESNCTMHNAQGPFHSVNTSE